MLGVGCPPRHPMSGFDVRCFRPFPHRPPHLARRISPAASRPPCSRPRRAVAPSQRAVAAGESADPSSHVAASRESADIRCPPRHPMSGLNVRCFACRSAALPLRVSEPKIFVPFRGISVFPLRWGESPREPLPQSAIGSLTRLPFSCHRSSCHNSLRPWLSSIFFCMPLRRASPPRLCRQNLCANCALSWLHPRLLPSSFFTPRNAPLR
jgi:hypothetical protein